MVLLICLEVFLLFLVPSSQDGVECTPTGVWIDDGTGQTVKSELPPWDAKVLRKNMLDLFGLPEPHRRRHHHHGSENGSAPTYMKNLFKEIDERGQAPRLDPQHRVTVDAADAIITFANKVPPHTPSKHLQFNLDDVPLEMVLLGAELMIHRSPVPSNDVVPGEVMEDLFLRVIVIHQDNSEQVIAKNHLKSDGWIGFKVTSTFLRWVINPPSNRGLRLSVRRANQKHEMQLYQGGITGSHGELNFRPFLVGYFSEGSEEARFVVNKIRKVREARPPTSDLKMSYHRLPFLSLSDQNDHDRRYDSQCQKMGLHVSFRDLGWQEWVIAPEGYDADYCDGKCQFPMLAHTNATNHAIIQTLVKLKHAVADSDELPPDACCAPKDLANIQVLYYDYSNNVVLKKYQKMIVKTCGCI